MGSVAGRVATLVAKLVYIVLFFLGGLFLFATVGMALDPEFSGTAPGAFLLAILFIGVALIIRFKTKSWEKRKSTPKGQQRSLSYSTSGARAFCEYCGAPMTSLAESCNACGRVPAPVKRTNTVGEYDSFEARERRRSLPPKLRYEILHRDGYTCRYCGRKPPEVELEVDHIEPVSQGGTDDPGNLMTSCRDCNRGKGIRSPLGGTTLAHPTVVVQREVREREIVKVKCRYCGSLNHDGAQKCNSCGANL